MLFSRCLSSCSQVGVRWLHELVLIFVAVLQAVWLLHRAKVLIGSNRVAGFSAGSYSSGE
jgi:hypothetical protein